MNHPAHTFSDDQAEAFVLGEKVAVMADGRIEQLATPRDLYQKPVSRWVASFVGDTNLLAGTANGATAMTAIGEIPLRESFSGPVDVLVRPEDVALSDGGGATVIRSEFYGHDVVATVDVDGQRLDARLPARTDWQPGDTVAVRYVGQSATAFSE